MESIISQSHKTSNLKWFLNKTVIDKINIHVDTFVIHWKNCFIFEFLLYYLIPEDTEQSKTYVTNNFINYFLFATVKVSGSCKNLNVVHRLLCSCFSNNKFLFSPNKYLRWCSLKQVLIFFYVVSSAWYSVNADVARGFPSFNLLADFVLTKILF